MDNKPEDYDVEILSPREKGYDLIEFLSKYKYEIVVHTNAESEYSYLENDDVELEVVNPFWNENLYIMLEGEFTLGFGAWHTHYFSYENDYSVMKEDIVGILEGKKGALKLSSTQRWLESNLYEGELSHYTDEYALAMSVLHEKEFINEINQLGGTIEILYWMPNDSYYFEIPPRSIVPEYKYPRRYNVRFVVQGENTLGSGSFKRYDAKLACMTYLYVDEKLHEGQRTELSEKLLHIIEKDAQKEGYSEIFKLCDADEVSFYLLHGYVEVSAKDENRFADLHGVYITDVKIMQKKL